MFTAKKNAQKVQSPKQMNYTYGHWSAIVSRVLPKEIKETSKIAMFKKFKERFVVMLPMGQITFPKDFHALALV